MRKSIFLIALAILLGTAPMGVMADEPKPVNTTNVPLTDQQELQRIEQRVLEIKNMDKSSLTKQQRKDLRKELVSMKKSARKIARGGVYLSVGAIIIIILVLILIL
ncbi:MAG TPA: hypothetical protein VEV16_06060 [Daejeonella sp.]|nr:hypothetical protein [Daejeonella sp.]